MGLKTKVVDISEVPEAFRELYKEGEDGEYILDVEGVREHPEVTALKNALDNERKERKKFKSEVDEFKSKFEDFDLDKYNELLEKAERAEEEESKKQGDVEKIIEKRLEKVQREYDKKIAQLDEDNKRLSSERDLLKGNYTKERVGGEVTRMANELGVRPSLVKYVVKDALDAFTLDEEGGIIHLDKDGETQVPGVSVKDWLDGFVNENRDFLEQSQGANSASTTSTRKAGSKRGKTVDLSQPNAIGLNLEAIAKGEVDSFSGDL